MRVAIIGCGFVADFYMQSLGLHPNLNLTAVTDRDATRLAEFCAYHRLNCAKPDIDAVLSDSSIGLIINLTNPDSHYEVSRRCLAAGKHVYSEKPVAMSFTQAAELSSYATRKGLRLACAPCNVLGETAQTLWKALRERTVGEVKLVHAEMDDGLVFRMPYRKWLSDSGRQWPYKDEFEVGCTLEHAGYYLTWLTTFFGPARSINAFSACLYPDKHTDVPLDVESPDYSVATIQFVSGVVARLTCSIIAPKDHRLRIIGDTGVLSVQDCWDYRAPVTIKRMISIRRKMLLSPIGRRVPSLRLAGTGRLPRHCNKMQFCRGVSEVVAAIEADRESRLPNDFCLHNNELALAIHKASEGAGTYFLTTSFAPSLTPMTEA